ncbi:hypothetical protein HG537_0D02090 [Torulaspora globosa]|uniref:Uncharacterized protein n=1 Tax=Torulaspora globosa TaxID=48254 RepID=A0A7H9HR39_9SACH|nr:hypothetical protein HG537_0D02090 [Torulaspora sp. CBS 2947]
MNTNLNPDNNISTPSLVGVSVRSIDDAHNPDFTDNPSRPHLHTASSSHVLNKITSQPSLADASYTSVAELNREGALLTDEVDLDQVTNATEIENDDEKQKQLQALKHRKQQKEKLKQKSKISIDSSSTSLKSMHSLDSRSLITSTDPIDDQINISTSSEPGRRRGATNDRRGSRNGQAKDDTIRNSYGEFIENKSHKPHLAVGESYQSCHESDVQSERDDERPGRRSRRSLDNQSSSTEYLRSLSRSLSRDPARRRNGGTNMNDVTEKLNNARLYSTNNYSISQADLESAPHIIQQTLAEEEEEEENEGALMDDQGNEDYPRELEEAAETAEQRAARHL